MTVIFIDEKSRAALEGLSFTARWLRVTDDPDLLKPGWRMLAEVDEDGGVLMAARTAIGSALGEASPKRRTGLTAALSEIGVNSNDQDLIASTLDRDVRELVPSTCYECRRHGRPV